MQKNISTNPTGIQIFNSEQFGKIRTCQVNNQIMFVGKDVAKALGYKDTSDALKKHVEVEDKLTRQIADSGQRRRTILINESGLYALLLSSKLTQGDDPKRYARNVADFIGRHLQAVGQEGWEPDDDVSWHSSGVLLWEFPLVYG